MLSFIDVNYEALRLKVEGQHQNLVDKSNEQASDLNLCLSNDFCLIIKENLKETMLERQIGRLRLKEQHFDSGKHESRRPSTSLVDESDVFGRQNEIKDLTDHLLFKDANGENVTVVPIVGMGGVGKTTRSDLFMCRARCAIIYVDIIECHVPDRVTRQFGY